jgi:predicted MFS family arabinose efflux permease
MTTTSTSEDQPLWTTLIGGMLALAVAMGVGRFVYTPILPIMVAELGLSNSEAGFIASVNFIGYMIGALLASTPWIGGSRRRWVLIGLLLSGLTGLAMGLTEAEPVFWMLRLASGIASAFVLVYVSAIVIQIVTRAGHPNYATVHFAGVGIGIAVSAAMVALLAAMGAAWYQQWYAAGVISIIAAFIVYALIPDLEGGGARNSRGTIDWSLTPLILAYGLFGFGYVITATFIVAMVREAPALLPLEPWIWMIAGLAGAPSVALWSWIAARIGLLHAFSAACLVEAVGVALSVLWVSIPGIIIAAIFLGGTFIGITALGLMAARRSVEGDPSRMLALMTAVFGIGQTIGPSFAGWLADIRGSYLAPSLAAAAFLVLAAGLAHVRGRQKRPVSLT